MITTITTERQCPAHQSTVSFITEVKTNGESVKYKRRIKISMWWDSKALKSEAHITSKF